MTERAAPGAQGSTVRNIEHGEMANVLTGGFIVPADEPTFSAQRWDALDETAFQEFDADYSSSSLDVTIQPGEAFVKGWLATDETYDIELDSFEDGQTVILAWDADAVYSDEIHESRNEADNVIVTLEQDLTVNVPYIPIWEFDTDGDGVTSAINRRVIVGTGGPGELGSQEHPLKSVYTDDLKSDDHTVSQSVLWDNLKMGDGFKYAEFGNDDFDGNIGGIIYNIDFVDIPENEPVVIIPKNEREVQSEFDRSPLTIEATVHGRAGTDTFVDRVFWAFADTIEIRSTGDGAVDRTYSLDADNNIQLEMSDSQRVLVDWKGVRVN